MDPSPYGGLSRIRIRIAGCYSFWPDRKSRISRHICPLGFSTEQRETSLIWQSLLCCCLKIFVSDQTAWCSIRVAKHPAKSVSLAAAPYTVAVKRSTYKYSPRASWTLRERTRAPKSRLLSGTLGEIFFWIELGMRLISRANAPKKQAFKLQTNKASTILLCTIFNSRRPTRRQQLAKGMEKVSFVVCTWYFFVQRTASLSVQHIVSPLCTAHC